MFNQYLIESTDIEKTISDYIAQKKIVKPKFDDLKYEVNRQVEKEGGLIFNKHCLGTGPELETLGLSDLSYSIPNNLHSIKSLGNKLSKLKINHPLVADLDQFHKKWLPVRDKWETLKTMVVKTTKVRAEKKQEIENEKQKKFFDSSTLVGALTKHLEDYKNRAQELATKQYEDTMKELEKHGWDLDKAAPRPHSRMTRSDYRFYQNRRDHLLALSDGDKNMRRFSPSKQAKFVQTQVDNAHHEYMSWVQKMIEKIGKPVTGATITGNPWVRSTLKVQTSDNEEQTWSTKMIINRSKYDKLFNQFPSRRIK